MLIIRRRHKMKTWFPLTVVPTGNKKERIMEDILVQIKLVEKRIYKGNKLDLNDGLLIDYYKKTYIALKSDHPGSVVLLNKMYKKILK